MRKMAVVIGIAVTVVAVGLCAAVWLSRPFAPSLPSPSGVPPDRPMPPTPASPASPDSTTQGDARGGKPVAEILRALEKDRPEWNLFRAALAACAARDPKATAAWVVENVGRGGDLAFALHDIMSQWVARDPKAALAWAQTLPVEKGRECAIRAVFSAWARLDPAAAAAELDAVTDLDSRNLVIGVVAYYWAQKDVRAATAWAWALPDGPGKVYALANIVMKLYPGDRKQAAEWAGWTRTKYGAHQAVAGLAGYLAHGDVEGAASWIARQLPGGVGPDPSFQVLVANWARSDPAAALAWARQIAEDRVREQALYTIICAILTTDWQAAALAVDSMPSGARKNSAARKIAQRWATFDAKAAQTWASQLSDSSAREAATQGAQGSPAAVPAAKESESPAVSSDIFFWPWWDLVDYVEQLPNGTLRNGLVHKTAVDMAREDPVGALAWVSEQLTAGRILETAMRVILWEWAARDAAGAADWVLALAAGDTREQSLASVALSLARTDPEAAADVAEYMTVGQKKTDVIGNIAFQWGRMDRESALEWAQDLTVQAEKDEALRQIRNARL